MAQAQALLSRGWLLPRAIAWRRPRLSAAGIVLTGAVLAPLVPWLLLPTGLWAERFHALGVPVYGPRDAVIHWPEQLFWLTAVALIGAYLIRPVPLIGDRWLGAMLVIAGGTIFVHGPMVDLSTVIVLGLMAFAFTVVRSADADTRALALRAVGAAGFFQSAYVLQQWLGSDFGVGILHAPKLRLLGTLGNEGFAAGFIALASLVGPWWGLPVAGLAIWLSGSVAPLLAFGIGLGIRYCRRNSLVFGLVAVASAIALMSKHAGAAWSASSGLRMDVWIMALRDWARGEPFFGWGLGAWARRIPDLQQATKIGMDGGPVSGYWFQAHNDLLQWVYETGLVGLVVLIGWAWSHRQVVLHATCGGAIAALAVLSVTWFPFHVIALGLVAVVILGCATAPALTREEAALWTG